jgi:hypothetical protein
MITHLQLSKILYFGIINQNMQSPSDFVNFVSVLQSISLQNLTTNNKLSDVSQSNVAVVNALISAAHSASNDSAFLSSIRTSLSNMHTINYS